MLDALRSLRASELRRLAAEIRGGRVALPPSAVALQRILPPAEAERVAAAFAAASTPPWHAEHLALLIEAVSAEREAESRAASAIELVWTGPDAQDAGGRETMVVVEELFASAQHEILLAGYAVHQGKAVFQPLAARMSALPGLRVRMFLDIPRGVHDTTAPETLVARFAQQFRERQWAGPRLPELYYDPRSVALEPQGRSSLHAKCVVIDDRVAFISSANFTEAAHQRNIELGVLVRVESAARQVAARFLRLAETGLLRRIAW